jgi:predicted transglutaminase-like cysteine proteinase
MLQEIDEAAFSSDVLEEINRGRGQRGLSELVADSKIEAALGRFIAARPVSSMLDDAGELQSHLRSEIPDAEYLTAAVFVDPRGSRLQERLRQWNEVMRPNYETLTTAAFRQGLRCVCIGVLATRLPPIDVHHPFPVVKRCFDTCSLCAKGNVVEFKGPSNIHVLACPHCGHPYDILAVDTIGRIRQAADFFQHVDHIPVQLFLGTRHAQLRNIWGYVLQRCSYQKDTSGFNRADVWKTPEETWQDCAGDCEDTSILLANSLINAQIDARVVIGWQDGAHAWCVARVGDRQFVLESALHVPPGGTLPEPLPVAEASAQYFPEFMFDNKRLYFRKDRLAQRKPCGDYWSERYWSAVVPPKRS